MVYLQHIDYSIQDCDIVVNLYRMPEITVNCIIERNDTGIFFNNIIKDIADNCNRMCVMFRYKILLKLSQITAMPEPDLQSAGVLKEFVISHIPEFIIETPFCKDRNAISPNSFTDIFMGCSVQGSKANVFLNSLKPTL